MPQYKVTLVTGSGVSGASESWIGGTWSPSTALGRINDLITARTKLLYRDNYWQGVRVGIWIPPQAAPTVIRRSQLFPPGSVQWPQANAAINVPLNGSFPPVDPFRPVTEDIWRAVVQLQVTYNGNQTKTRYLSGAPNAVSAGTGGAYTPAGDPNWDAALATYIQAVKGGGWGIQALDRTNSNPAFYLTSLYTRPGALPELGMEFRGTPPNWDVGARVQLQGFRPPKGQRTGTLNGTWYLSAISTTDFPGHTVFYLRNSQAVTPQMVRFTDKSRVYLYQYVVYPVDYISAIRVGIHKRGRPITAPAGRRLNRPTLDP